MAHQRRRGATSLPAPTRYEVNNLFIHHFPIMESGRVPRRLKRAWPRLWGIYDNRDPVEVAAVWVALAPIVAGMIAGLAALVLI